MRLTADILLWNLIAAGAAGIGKNRNTDKREKSMIRHILYLCSPVWKTE